MSAAAIPLAPPQERAINPWIVAVTVMLATFMEVLDTSVANVALPNIAGNLSVSPDEATWVLTAYLVANAIVLPLSGWFSTLFGRKNFYLTCVGIFTVSSFLCGIAPSLEWLILFRVLQGLGGGALQPISQAILFESFPREKQGSAMAFYGLGVVVAPVIGPLLGGWITDNYSWRWIFLINIPIGALSVMLTTALIYDPAHLIRKTFATGLKLDYIGLGLLSIGLASLEVCLDEGQRKDWFGSNLIVTALIVAVIALVAVVLWELRQKDPVVDFRILANRNFALSSLTMYVTGFTLYGSTAILPIFLQTVLGYTALQSGLVLVPGGIALMIGMIIVGRVIGRVDTRWLIMGGLLVSSIGIFEMSRFNLDIDFQTAMWARTTQAAGLAFLFVPVNTMAFGSVQKEKLGYATGLMNLFRNIGGSAGIAMVITILARRQQFHQSVLASHLTPVDAAYNETIQGIAGTITAQGASAADAAMQAQGVVYSVLQRQASMLAVADVFFVLGVIFLALVPLVFFLKKSEPPKGQVMME
jgi:DHA2 family multidrug resistance protein